MVYIIPYQWFFLVIFLIDLLLLLLIFFGWGRGLCILSCHGFEPILRKQSFNWRYRMTCFCLSVYEIKFLFFFPAVTSVPGVVFSCSSVIMHCVPVCCLYFTPVWYSSLCCSPYFCFFFPHLQRCILNAMILFQLFRESVYYWVRCKGYSFPCWFGHIIAIWNCREAQT